MFVKWSGPQRRGRQVRYLQIVHSYVEKGKHLHRLVANLGELSQQQIAVMVRSFNRLLDRPYVLRMMKDRRDRQSR
jgi:hypothetical protein